MKIVFGSHTCMGGPFVIGSHHLARELHRMGHEVVHVSTPVTPAHLVRLHDADVRRRFGLALRPDRPEGVLNLVPAAALPWSLKRAAPWLWERDLALPPRSLRRALLRMLGGPPDLLVVDQPKLAGLMALLSPARSVYRATDVYSEMQGNAGIRHAERAAVLRADLVVATSQPVAEHLSRLGPRRPPLVLPNGVDQGHFSRPAARPAEYNDHTRARVVYVGALDYRFDFDTLDLLAARWPQVEFVVIGPGTALSRERGYAANVTLLGARHYSAVPAYLQHAQAALLLMNEHPANAGRSPMKLYEYGAAGLRVLARSTPELQRRAEAFVTTYDDAEGAASGLARALAAPAALAQVGQAPTTKLVPAPEPERIARAAWSGIAEQLLVAAFADDPDGDHPSTKLR